MDFVVEDKVWTGTITQLERFYEGQITKVVNIEVPSDDVFSNNDDLKPEVTCSVKSKAPESFLQHLLDFAVNIEGLGVPTEVNACQHFCCEYCQFYRGCGCAAVDVVVWPPSLLMRYHQ